MLNFIKTSLIKQFGSDFKRVINKLIQTHPARKLYLLIERYKAEFPRGIRLAERIPTPIVCACQHVRVDDVELFINLHPYHKYITNSDVNGYRDDMTFKDMVDQFGKNSGGYEWKPLLIAATMGHFHVVKYLIEQGEADPNITIRHSNALHMATGSNRTTTALIELLLTNMSLDSINKKAAFGLTPLDYAYECNKSVKQKIIYLIRSKGGKANYHDENGINVGEGNGDLIISLYIIILLYIKIILY